MIKTLLCYSFLFVLAPGSLSAQVDSIPTVPSKKHSIPLYVGGGLTVPVGLELTAGGFNRSGWGGSLSFNAIFRTAKNLPADFDGGRGLFGEGSDKIDNDYMAILSFRALKVVDTDSKNTFLGLEIGPSILVSMIADNFIRVPNPCTYDPIFGTYCSRNYNYDRFKRTAFGLSIKGKLGIDLFDNVGLELGIQSNWNANWPYLGVDVLFLLGNVRYK
jgi:hypothetical protein